MYMHYDVLTHLRFSDVLFTDLFIVLFLLPCVHSYRDIFKRHSTIYIKNCLLIRFVIIWYILSSKCLKYYFLFSRTIFSIIIKFKYKSIHFARTLLYYQHIIHENLLCYWGTCWFRWSTRGIHRSWYIGWVVDVAQIGITAATVEVVGSLINRRLYFTFCWIEPKETVAKLNVGRYITMTSYIHWNQYLVQIHARYEGFV